jgi:hypothetical protein
MAAQNILLAATDKGVGSCVIHSFRPHAVQRFLDLPEHVVPILLVALGYTARPSVIPTRRPLRDVLFWGRRSNNREVKAGESENKQHVETKNSTNESLPHASSDDFPIYDSTSLVIYVLSSTRGLLEEPLRYGPMRLLDTLCRLIEFLDRHGLAEKRVKHIFEKLVCFKEKGFAAYPHLADELDSALAELSAGL